MKKNKGIIVSLVAVIILLVVVAGISITYNFLGGFYYCRVVEYNKVMGEDLIINVSGEGAHIAACNFSGSLVADGSIKQRVDVNIEKIENPLYLRAKFGVEDFKYVGYMYDGLNWVNGSDGYLYYNGQVNSYDKINLCNRIYLQLQMGLKSSTNYIMHFIVEGSLSEWEYNAI